MVRWGMPGRTMARGGGWTGVRSGGGSGAPSSVTWAVVLVGFCQAVPIGNRGDGNVCRRTRSDMVFVRYGADSDGLGSRHGCADAMPTTLPSGSGSLVDRGDWLWFRAVELPKYDHLFKPTMEVLANLGGSGSIEEINDETISSINVSREQLDVSYPTSGASVLLDRMSWARNFPKFAGLIENPKRGERVLTEHGRISVAETNAELKYIVDSAYKLSISARKTPRISDDTGDGQGVADKTIGWLDQLLHRVQGIDAIEGRE